MTRVLLRKVAYIVGKIANNYALRFTGSNLFGIIVLEN